MSDSNSAPAVPASFAGDLLRGVDQIAAFIGTDRRRTYALCAKKMIPVGKQGQLYVGSRQVLAQHYRKLLAGEI
jgi:hypothetical protein